MNKVKPFASQKFWLQGKRWIELPYVRYQETLAAMLVLGYFLGLFVGLLIMWL